MYEGDTPNAERRAAALALDRDLLRELLGQEELRELIDPAALEEVETDLQRISDRTRAANSDGLHDVLRALGDLTVDEAQVRSLDAVSAKRMLLELEKQRRAVRMRIGGEERWIASEDAGLFRDALGAVPPGGLPDAFLEEVEEPLARLARRYARTHGPFTTREPSRRYAVDMGPVLRELEQSGKLIRGELRPGGSEREWCDADVLRRLRRASLASLRREVEPAEQRALARLLPAWQGVDSAPAGGAGVDRLREQLVPLQGLALAPAGLGARRASAAGRELLAGLARSAVRRRRAGVGRRGLARAASGRVALYFRDDARWLGPPPVKGDPPSEPIHAAIRGRLESGAAFWTDLLADLAETEPVELQEALWDLVWAGEVTNDAFAPLRAPRLALARRERDGGRRFARRRRPGAPQVQGRWSLTAPLFADAPSYGPRMRALAEVLLERYGIVTRETVLAEGIPGGFAGDVRGVRQPGDAGHRPARLLRGGPGRRPVRAARGDRAAAQPARRRARRRPGAGRHRSRERVRRRAALATRDDESRAARLAWPGAYVVTLDAEPALYVERGGKGLVALRDPDESWLRPALEALAEAVRRGRVSRLGLERFDGEPVVGTPVGGAAGGAGVPAGAAEADAERLGHERGGRR